MHINIQRHMTEPPYGTCLVTFKLTENIKDQLPGINTYALKNDNS